MPSRQTHSKTRHGCTKCKQRKVRCDQGRPICRNCERLGHECSFALDQPFVGSSGSQVTMSRHASDEGSVKSSQGLPVQDLELMHHYSTSTCFTMTDESDLCSLWQTDIPRLALDHPFLLHGILALAALHLHHTNPQSSTPCQPVYTEIASIHQDLALSSYRIQLQSINEANCHALFAFSSVLGALSYGFIQQSQDLDDKSFVKNVVDVFDLLVGAKVVVIEAQSWLKQGKLAPLLVQPHTLDSSTMSTVFDAINISLDGLAQDIDQMSSSMFDYYGAFPEGGGGNDQLGPGPVYKSAILWIKRLIGSSSIHEGSISRVIGWPVVIDGQFLALLRQGDIMALVILAHYGALFCSLNHVWWARGLGSRLIQAVVGVVGPSYHTKYLREPMVWI